LRGEVRSALEACRGETRSSVHALDLDLATLVSARGDVVKVPIDANDLAMQLSYFVEESVGLDVRQQLALVCGDLKSVMLAKDRQLAERRRRRALALRRHRRRARAHGPRRRASRRLPRQR